MDDANIWENYLVIKMTALSVNVNKFALVRNARGADLPNLIDISDKCLNYGADGITVHPRPDERHAKFSDLEPLKNLLSKFENKEFNVEGYPSDFFVKKVIEVKPDQVTLVPDPPGALTSSFGWDCETNKNLLTNIVSVIFVSLFFLIVFQVLLRDQNIFVNEYLVIARAVSFSGFIAIPLVLFIFHNFGKNIYLINNYSYSLVLFIWIISTQIFL